MRAGTVDVLYVHDDNLGSHAHYELFDSAVVGEDGYETLMLRRGRSDRQPPPWWTPDEWAITSALVPKPEKMRLPIESLFLDLLELRPLLQLLVPGMQELYYSVRHMSGIEYLRWVLDAPLNPAGRQEFLTLLAVPRFVAIVSMHHRDTHLLDAVLDVSEVDNGLPGVLAFVAPGFPSQSAAWRLLQQLSASTVFADCPIIGAP